MSTSHRFVSSLLLWFLFLDCCAAGPARREERVLAGGWEFQRDGAPSNAWKTVPVPSSFQEHEGYQFHGVGWYRRRVEPEWLRGAETQRVFLHFSAAATLTEVWWNHQRLGQHLGGWTPFRWEVTDRVRSAPSNQTHEIRVRLDEKVGHNTQGFLPIIQPHFGGLWQEVKLLFLPEVSFDDLTLALHGDLRTRVLHFSAALQTPRATEPEALSYRIWLRDENARVGTLPWPPTQGRASFAVPIPDAQAWSPETPQWYEVELELRRKGVVEDRIRARAAFRQIEARGDHFSLNGRPVSLRGVLNWGYYPPRLAPQVDEARFRRDIELARASGFNLMKFCLWVPPKRFLELCDELGMLVWMEYPTWHPQLTPQHLVDLRQEFREFFNFDRNHPSILLRSLTCETGPGADLDVIQQLYDLAHQTILGALVEDDSSWIGWNRVHDFYDDHPYGNNHTWVKTLAGFREYILAHGPKPLALGECMAADTWVDRLPLLDRVGTNRPYWLPGFLDATKEWLERLETIAGADGLSQLLPESQHYAMLMRQYQVEALRRELPYAGYVVSVMRDFPLATMGLLDYADRPKWSARDWAWQGDTMCLLHTENDRRSFWSGEHLRADLLLSHFGPRKLEGATVRVRVQTAADAGEALPRAEKANLAQNSGTLASLLKLDVPLPAVSEPRQVLVRAELTSPTLRSSNGWSVWVLPQTQPEWKSRIVLHESVSPEMARELFDDAPRAKGPTEDRVLIAARFDDALVASLERGGRVLLLPDGQKQSLPLSAHWFLRGAPWVGSHPLARRAPRSFWIEQQHFDLASQVVPEMSYLEEVDPILLLWDTHDLKTVKTHGLIFETRAGGGRLLVSAVNHRAPSNAAGRWLLAQCVEHLERGESPRHALSPASWRRVKEKLHEARLDLTRRPWRFKPDPEEKGVKQNWAAPGNEPDASWKEIHLGQHWESQGYPALDKWAWYRLNVTVPESWQGRPVYLSFEGVDDMYELFVDGEFVARRGDLATRQDTFNEKFSHDLTRWLSPGRTHVVAVRVYDWYGAGGIFRPVTLGTSALNPKGDFLK